MSVFAQVLPQEPDLELPLPPAVTRRGAVPPADDDVVFMPPFSRARVSPPEPHHESAPLPLPEFSDEAEPTPVESAGPPVPPVPEPPEEPAFEPERDLATEVAERLEGIAEELRRQGFHALLKPRSEQEPIDVVLASVIAGFLARR